MKTIIYTLLLSMFVVTATHAQLETPQPSPLHKSTQTVGLTDITLEYSRPGVKDRMIFGNLVPYGKMWRTGANASTKFEISNAIKVNGKNLEAGRYALYTIPGEKEWTIIFHNNTSHWGIGDYDKSEDALRVTVEAEKIEPSIETMIIEINNIRNTSASLDIMWENTLVSIPLELMTDNQVQANIDRVMAGPSASDYYVAARYFYEEDKDMSQALGWVEKCLNLDGEKFWVVRLKSLIQAKLGDYKSAIKTAERSAELAEEAGNKSYIKLNQDKIKEWKDKM